MAKYTSAQDKVNLVFLLDTKQARKACLICVSPRNSSRYLRKKRSLCVLFGPIIIRSFIEGRSRYVTLSW